MGAYASNFQVDTEGAVASFTSPRQSNWITAHAIATELAIPEVERLWLRFQQLGCDEGGLLSLTDPLPPQMTEDAVIRNILKTMRSVDGKVTFQSFLVSLKWIECESMDKKIRATFHLLNHGQPLDKKALRKVLQKVYPEDSDVAVSRLTDVFFSEMDTHNKGFISEAEFVNWVRRMPQETIAQLTEFHILPQDISLDAQEQLSEFRGSEFMASRLGGATPAFSGTPAASGTPADEVLERVAERICRRDWVLVGTRLGLLQQDMDYLISRFPDNPMQQAYHMLLDWKRKSGREGRTEILDKTLRSSSMTDAALVLLPH